MTNHLQFLPRDLDAVIKSLIDPVYHVNLEIRPDNATLVIRSSRRIQEIISLSPDVFERHSNVTAYVRTGVFTNRLNGSDIFTMRHISTDIVIQDYGRTTIYTDPDNSLHTQLVNAFKKDLASCDFNRCVHPSFDVNGPIS